MVVDARAVARRIVEQVLAEHAARTGTPAVPARPAVPDTPAWRTARRIVDEVLAAHGARAVPAVQGATLVDVVEGPALSLVHLEQATEEGTAQTVGRIVRRAAADGDDPEASTEPTEPVPTEPVPPPSTSGSVEPASAAPAPAAPKSSAPAPAPPHPPEARPPLVITYGGDVDTPAVVARRIVAEVLTSTVPPPVRPQPPIEPPRPLEPPRPPVEPQPLPPIEPDPRPHEPDPEPHEPQPEPEPVGAASHPAEPMDGWALVPIATPVATIVPGPTVRRDDRALRASERVERSTAPLSETAPAPLPKRTGRWLLATLLGAIALAWLFPLAVGALRDLVRLSS